MTWPRPPAKSEEPSGITTMRYLLYLKTEVTMSSPMGAGQAGP